MGYIKDLRQVRAVENPAPRTAEHRLIVAVLQRAITDYLGDDTELAEDAKTWLFAEQFAPYEVFTLGWICEQIDLNVEITIDAIRKLAA